MQCRKNSTSSNARNTSATGRMDAIMCMSNALDVVKCYTTVERNRWKELKAKYEEWKKTHNTEEILDGKEED